MRRPLVTARLALICLAAALCATTIVIQPVHCDSVEQAPSSPSDSGSATAGGVTAQSAPESKSSAPAVSPGETSAEKASPKGQSGEPERKARASDQAAPAKSDSAASPSSASDKEADLKSKDDSVKATTGPASKPANSDSDKKAAKPAQAAAAKQQQQAQLAGKSGQKSKLPANLGTVTSTGSGGPAHYMSKHDAYSAIAEKHGALAQDAMRHTQKVSSDRRTHLQRFGGIQKASGFGDMLSPFKGVTDGGLARTLGASMRSIMKGKYSIPAYVASAVLGAVALLAFYESPISPLPVPALPGPPVGRFPPEMPNISPSVQVPFRMNQQQQQQQQSYEQQAYTNQRSFPGVQMPAQQQQVLFPGATAQQRQLNTGGPVQNLAANLLSSVGGKLQNAQRKSGFDHEPSSSRSLFGVSGASSQPKLSAPANQAQKQSSSFLSFLGFGASQPVGAPVPSGADLQQAASGGAPATASLEAKGQATGAAALSNSHVVNKVKSYFARAPSAPAPHTGQSAGANPYDQYQRMSLMQALAKDTAFLPAFLSPTRKSSQASPAGSSSAANKIQQSINNVLSAAAAASAPSASSGPATGAQSAAAASRMQVDAQPQYGTAHGQPQPSAGGQSNNNKRASSGYGLMRAADRLAHALLDTVTSGLLQRNAPALGAQSASHQADTVARKSQTHPDESPLMSTASLLSDIMLSSYGSGPQQQSAAQFVSSLAQAAGLPSAPVSDQHQAGASSDAKPSASEQASARSDQGAFSASEQPEQQKQQQASAGLATSASQDQAGHARKTRSIGLDYPTFEASNMQQPSRAAQITDLVDLVSNGYKQNKMLFTFVMNQVGLSYALPYVEQILGDRQIGMPNHLIR